MFVAACTAHLFHVPTCDFTKTAVKTEQSLHCKIEHFLLFDLASIAIFVYSYETNRILRFVTATNRLMPKLFHLLIIFKHHLVTWNCTLLRVTFAPNLPLIFVLVEFIEFFDRKLKRLFYFSLQQVKLRVRFDMSCISILRRPCMSLGEPTFRTLHKMATYKL